MKPLHLTLLIALLSTAILSPCAVADFVAVVADSYAVEENGEMFAVIDLYAQFDTNKNILEAVFGTDITLTGANSWFHSDSEGICPDGGTWSPVTSTTNPLSDSFVTIGAPPGPDNATVLDPLFDDSIACSSALSENAGWFNSNPPNEVGTAMDIMLSDGEILENASLMGRFSIAGLPDEPAFLNVNSLSIAYTLGLDKTMIADPAVTDLSIAYVPAPGSIMLLWLGFSVRNRRRR